LVGFSPVAGAVEGADTEADTGADAELVARAGVALAALRKVKSEAKTSQKTPILSVTLAVAADRPEYAEAIEAVRADLTEAAKVTGPFTVEQAAPAADPAQGASPVGPAHPRAPPPAGPASLRNPADPASVP